MKIAGRIVAKYIVSTPQKFKNHYSAKKSLENVTWKQLINGESNQMKRDESIQRGSNVCKIEKIWWLVFLRGSFAWQVLHRESMTHKKRIGDGGRGWIERARNKTKIHEVRGGGKFTAGRYNPLQHWWL